MNKRAKLAARAAESGKQSDRPQIGRPIRSASKVIVGYNGTNSSTEAVEWAAHEAAARASQLRIVSCFEGPAYGDAIAGWPATQALASLMEVSEAALADVRLVVAAEHPDLQVVTKLSATPAADGVLEDVGADDLVVVGASTHHGAAAFWLGSTPRHLVRRSPCPVAVVRGAASRGRPDRIVVGVDGSPAALDAVRWAADEADRYEVDLVVVHGWWYPYPVVGAGTSQARDLTEVDAACVVNKAVEFARSRCAATVKEQLVEDGPASALLRSVTDGDLLVLSSRGRGAIRAGLFGSTVNSVLEQSAVPVVVVPSTN